MGCYRVAVRFIVIAFALFFCADSRGYQDSEREIDVVIRDSDSKPIPNALVVLSAAGRPETIAHTDATGSVRFRHLGQSSYRISVSKDGFQPVENKTVALVGTKPNQPEFILLLLRHNEQVEVKATADSLSPSSQGTTVATSAAREPPSRPEQSAMRSRWFRASSETPWEDSYIG